VEDGAFIPFVCHSRERNNISFEDRERTLEEIMLLFFNTGTPYAFNDISITYKINK